MNEYTRDNIQSTMLKVVVFRIDFTGLTNLESFISRIKETGIRDKFAKMVKIPQQSMSVQFKPKDIEEGQLPYTEAQKSQLFKFYDCLIYDSSEATLDVENESITLVINGEKNYQGSYKYSRFIAWIINELKTFDSYVSINRVGIRKIDAVLAAEKDIYNYFNENYFVAESWKSNPRKLKSVLTELIEKDSVNINVIQHIDKAENDNVKLIYDVDAFLNGNKVSSIIKEGSLFHFLYHDMQDAMFELFKSVVSEKYLEQCKQLKEKQIKEKQNEQND